MNVRGSVIPIIDLAAQLGVRSTIDTSRAAIVVAEVGRSIVTRRPYGHPADPRFSNAAFNESLVVELPA